MNGTCGECRHYDPTKVGGITGRCRKYPPQVIALPMGIGVDGKAQWNTPEDMFPPVSVGGYCGEFVRAFENESTEKEFNLMRDAILTASKQAETKSVLEGMEEVSRTHIGDVKVRADYDPAEFNKEPEPAPAPVKPVQTIMGSKQIAPNAPCPCDRPNPNTGKPMKYKDCDCKGFH